MTQEQGMIVVLEHELNTLRGLRLSRDTAVASAAVSREQAVEKELTQLRRQDREPELNLRHVA